VSEPHGIYYYGCGRHIKFQCRCPSAVRIVLTQPCPHCAAAAAKSQPAKGGT
jgi:hypothetical protein